MSASTRDVAQRTRELGRGSHTYALVRVCVRARARTLSDGASPSLSVSELERRVRAATRRAHGSVDGAFEAEVLGARAGDGAGAGTTFAVRCEAAHWRRLWSALTMASEWDEEGGRACAYDVLGTGASLQELATAGRDS